MKKLKIGDKVIYKPKNQKGIVKFVNNQCAWVVYSCGGNWDKYKDYTGESTVLSDLRRGWEENKLKSFLKRIRIKYDKYPSVNPTRVLFVGAIIFSILNNLYRSETLFVFLVGLLSGFCIGLLFKVIFNYIKKNGR